MNVETTMYIRKDLLDRITERAETLNISRSRYVSLLLLKYIKMNKCNNKVFIKLKYQPRGEFNYNVASLSLREDIYERWCDVRKVYKCSASLIISIAFELYDELLFKELNNVNETYNYSEFYSTEVRIYQNSYINMIIWGLPEAEVLKKILEIP